MSASTRIQFLRYGKHASASSFDAAPSAYKFIRAIGTPVWDLPYNREEQDVQSYDGEEEPAITAGRGLALPDLSFYLEGLSGGGAGDGVDAASLDTAMSEFLEALTGATEVDSTGETTDAADAGSGTTVTMDASAVNSAGEAMLVKGTSSGKYSAVEIVSVSGTDYTIDRALTDDDGSADTADEAEVAYGGRTFVFDNDVLDHVPVGFYAGLTGVASSDAGITAWGALGDATLQFPRQQAARLALSGWECNEWDRVATSSPTYSAPTTGDKIIGTEMQFHIGSTLYQAFGFEFGFGLELAEREHDGGVNGRFGRAVLRKRPVLRGSIRLGTLTSPNEATLANLETWDHVTQGASATFDISLQVGRNPGRACYIRMPAARFTSMQRSESNGQMVARFEAVGTRSGNHSNVPGSCRIHVF